MEMLVALGLVGLGSIALLWSHKDSMLGNICAVIIYGAAGIQIAHWIMQIIHKM